MFKTVTLALAAIAASATLASANTNNLSDFVQHQDNTSRVELGLVRAAGDGVVEVYRLQRGEPTALLGSEMVHAGANQDVNVMIPRTTEDSIAVLKVDGQIVDTQRLEFN